MGEHIPQRHASLPPPTAFQQQSTNAPLLPCASLSNTVASTLTAPPESIPSLHRRKGSTAVQIDDDESSTMMEATVHQFHSALEQIVKKNAVVATVTLLLKVCPFAYFMRRNYLFTVRDLFVSLYSVKFADCFGIK